MTDTAKEAWESYCESELALLRPLLAELRIALDDNQPHITGERYLMQAVTTASGRKVILLGSSSGGERLVIKASSDAGGIKELRHEQACRSAMAQLPFAYEAFLTPPQHAFIERSGMTVSVTSFIEQESPFLVRPIREQAAFVLRSLIAQEHVHATTASHFRPIRKVFEQYGSDRYLERFSVFADTIRAVPEFSVQLGDLLESVDDTLRSEKIAIERYCGFLTHTDFVPHNFRINGDELYLLDLSSVRFGNKHEGWARLINFMELYNPELAAGLMRYVRDNRSPEEQRSLYLMRYYRLTELLLFYVRSYGQSEGSLKDLSRVRVEFWSEVLRNVLQQTPIPTEVVNGYKTKRDSLRSPEEHKRQIGLH